MTRPSFPACPEPIDRAALIGGLIGLPWVERAAGPDAFDCWGLAAHVQSAIWARSLPWSAEIVSDATALREVIAAIRKSQLHRAWLPVPDPADGDLVLMYQGAFPSHAGVWLDHPETGTGILHASRKAGVSFDSLANARAEWNRITFHRFAEAAIDRVAATRIDHLVPAGTLGPEEMAQPVAIRVSDLLDPLANAAIVDIPVGLSVLAAAQLAGVALPGAEWAVLNDLPLLRVHPETGEDEWQTYHLRPGDVLWFLPPLPEGGDDGSAVLASLVAIVATIAAPWAVGALFPGMVTASGALTLGGNLLAAGLSFGVQTLVGQFVPTPQTFRMPDPEPTYSFQEVRNTIRPTETIPRPYGTMRRVPDLLARPWAEFVDNQQIIHLLLSVGHGVHDVTEFGVSDTAVWRSATGYTGAIQQIEHEVILPGGSPTLFPATVEVNAEVAGISLSVPDLDPETSVPAAVVIGPFVAVASGQQASRLVLDFAFPRGCFSVDAPLAWDGLGTWTATGVSLPDRSIVARFPDAFSGAATGNKPPGFGSAVDGVKRTAVQWEVKAQQINDYGQPVGFWQSLGVVTFVAGTVTPQRLTEGFDVSPGRYQVTVERVTQSYVQGSGAQDELVWAGLRAHIVADSTLPHVTALALRIRADAGSATAVDQVYVRSTAVLPHFDTTTGAVVTGPTEQIDAAVLDIARAPTGLGLTDAQIDMPELSRLARIWQARGDVCCTVVEGDQGCWEVLENVLTAGRTRPQFVGATLTFVRDEHRPVGARLVTHADMVRGSFEVARAHFRREAPNVVTMQYRDREGAARSIECRPEGVTDPRPAIVSTKVMVDAAQVWREGHYLAASNNLRRRYPSWVMLAEGRSLVRGQVVKVSHPRPDWGRPSRLVSVSWPVLDLSEPHGLADGAVGWISVKTPDGLDWGPVRVLPVPLYPGRVLIDEADFAVALAGLQAGGFFSPDPRDWLVAETDFTVADSASDSLSGQQIEPTRVTVGRDGSEALRCLILEVNPRDDGQVEVLAVEDVAKVHTADQTPLPDGLAVSGTVISATAPLWSGVVIRTVDAADPARAGQADIQIDGPPVAGATAYVVEWTPDLAEPWVLAATSTEPSLAGPVVTDADIYLRVAARSGVVVGVWSVFVTNLAGAVNGTAFALPVLSGDPS